MLTIGAGVIGRGRPSCDSMLLLSAPSSVDSNTTRWLVIAAAAATIAYAVLRPMLKKRDPMSKSPGSSNLAQQRSVEREMSNLLVELSEMTRQLSAQLDTRSAKLEELMRQADAKIAELRARGMLPPSSDSPAALPAPTQAQPLPAPTDYPLAGLGLIPADNAGVPPRPTLSTALEAATNRQQIDPRHAQIYAFVDQGLSPQEIAHRLGRPAGEVELILALRSHS
jgi:DNA-directed RNA polymerase specialized sigma24 family protein